MRAARRARAERPKPEFSLGDRIADQVAATMGSWNFIIIQSVLLLIWIMLNVTAYVQQWDPYPFILLNLALSFQAAYAAPFIMMSQNRQAAIDRAAAQTDYGDQRQGGARDRAAAPKARHAARDRGVGTDPGHPPAGGAPSRAGGRGERLTAQARSARAFPGGRLFSGGTAGRAAASAAA